MAEIHLPWSAGVRFDLAEVESALCEHPAVHVVAARLWELQAGEMLPLAEMGHNFQMRSFQVNLVGMVGGHVQPHFVAFDSSALEGS